MHQFNKPVVGNGLGEKVFFMDFDKIEIKVFHVSESPGMEHHHNGNDFAQAHSGPSLGPVSKNMFFSGFFKLDAEFIDKIENFGNFGVS